MSGQAAATGLELDYLSPLEGASTEVQSSEAGNAQRTIPQTQRTIKRVSIRRTAGGCCKEESTQERAERGRLLQINLDEQPRRLDLW